LEAVSTLKRGGRIDIDHRDVLLELSAVLDQYTAHKARGGIIPISRGLLTDQAIATWRTAKLAFEREAADPVRLSRISRALLTLAQAGEADEAARVSPEVEEFCNRLLDPAND
jgi:hypothetical protein